ncbi:phosphotransferase [Streptosporangium subroseum]|uniref:phosphotransferase n=1 Tax=Streptosporangium subroseum TaxID=106412 RepID=UPI0034343D61
MEAVRRRLSHASTETTQLYTLLADEVADAEIRAAAPDWAGPALWLHGDLHPANVLTAGDTFCGVIAFGDLCAGDPACTLAAAWILLPDGTADRFYGAYWPASDAATLRRAHGWAVLRALSGILIGEAGVHGRRGASPHGVHPPTPHCAASSQRPIADQSLSPRARIPSQRSRPCSACWGLLA